MDEMTVWLYMGAVKSLAKRHIILFFLSFKFFSYTCWLIVDIPATTNNLSMYVWGGTDMIAAATAASPWDNFL